MRPIEPPDHRPTARRSSPVKGRIELLNSRWHGLLRTGQRFGRCATCAADIAPGERVVYLYGEAYHAACADSYPRR